jgi:serine/threonine-protein kinase
VTGQTLAAASQALSAAGFSVTHDDVFSDTIPSGKVVGTDPAAGQGANRGSQVAVHVSKGPEMVPVPNLVGMTLEAAQAQLQAKGFEVDTQSYLPGRLVRAQSPAANTSVTKGTKVTLFF